MTEFGYTTLPELGFHLEEGLRSMRGLTGEGWVEASVMVSDQSAFFEMRSAVNTHRCRQGQKDESCKPKASFLIGVVHCHNGTLESVLVVAK
jgi:hypothetical protein